MKPQFKTGFWIFCGNCGTMIKNVKWNDNEDGITAKCAKCQTNVLIQGVFSK